MNEKDYQEPEAPRGCAGLFFVAMVIMGAFGGVGLGFFAWVVNDANHGVVEVLADFRPKVGSKVYSSDGQPVGEFSIEERHLVRLNDIPLQVQKAFVATEDHLFYEHRGVRPDAIVNAFFYLLQTGRSRGGSTITQQVVRNVETLEVGLARTMQRKLHEAIVALQVEREFTKDEILELYLNQIFLGISAWGVEAASYQYFGKSSQELSLGEAATLAGVARWPNLNNPIVNFKAARERRDVVLRQMLRRNLITSEAFDAARAEDMEASVAKRDRAQQAVQDYSVRGRFRAPYFIEEVRRFALDRYASAQVFEDGLEIHTTLDMRLQAAAERALLEALDTFDEEERKRLERQGKLDEFTPVSGGLVCIDNRPPYRGFVRAMVGGRDFVQEKFNTVTQARRQPGSSIKPFVWASAVAAGMTPSTIVVDAPFQRIAPNGVIWAPKNFDGGFSGPVPIRVALEKSINIVSIKLVEQVGTPMVRSYLQRCGIPTDVEGLTIALGSGEVRLLDHAVAYSVFANGGVRHDPILITEIRDRDGMQRYNYRDYARSEQAMDAKVAYITLSMLKGACEPGHGENHYPTGWRTHVLERPRAGKTGTTNSSRDAWFCGITPAYTTVVWVGYRDNRPLGRGRDYTGGRLAAPIWIEFMLEAHQGVPVEDFEVPPGIEFHNVNRMTGTLGGKYKDAFMVGAPPPAQWYGDEYASQNDYVSLDDGTQIPLLEAL